MALLECCDSSWDPPQDTLLDTNHIQQEITQGHSLHIEDYLTDTLNTDLTGDYFLDTPGIQR